jgi:hypothetical protein
MAVKKAKTATGSVKIVHTNIAGVAPGVTQDKQRFRRFFPHPIQPRLSIKTVIKQNPADGLSLPDASTLGGTAGVSTPGAGGYKGALIVHQQPATPPANGKNLRSVAAPSPTSGAGVRSPFNQKVGVGKRGKNTRINRGGGSSAPRSPGL